MLRKKYINRFRRDYTRSMLAASLAFAFTHSIELLIIGFYLQHSLALNPTGFLVLLPYDLMEIVVFFVAGWVLAYFPVCGMYVIVGNAQKIKPLTYILAGIGV